MIPLVSDVMFHTMFNNENRKQYVCYFLSLVLGKNRKEIETGIEFVKNKIDQESVHEKRKTVDLVCRFQEEIWNIEMNNATTITQLERNISYLMDLYKNQMKRGNKYQYQKIVQMNINNFSFVGHKETMQKYYLRNDEGLILTDKVQIIYFYLPNIKEKYYNKEKLLLIFNEIYSKEIKEWMEENEIMKAYRKEAKEASQEEVIGLYDKELVDEMIRYNELKEAKESRNLEIAKNMLTKRLHLNVIAECTGLNMKELEKMKLINSD